jgi:hypothetical protein
VKVLDLLGSWIYFVFGGRSSRSLEFVDVTLGQVRAWDWDVWEEVCCNSSMLLADWVNFSAIVDIGCEGLQGAKFVCIFFGSNGLRI